MQNSGRSSGLLLEIIFLSTTQALSTHLAPAFIKSSFIPGVDVQVNPLTMPAEIGIHPAWQICATNLPELKIFLVISSNFSSRLNLSGAKPPGITSALKLSSFTSYKFISDLQG